MAPSAAISAIFYASSSPSPLENVNDSSIDISLRVPPHEYSPLFSLVAHLEGSSSPWRIRRRPRRVGLPHSRVLEFLGRAHERTHFEVSCPHGSDLLTSFIYRLDLDFIRKQLRKIEAKINSLTAVSSVQPCYVNFAGIRSEKWASSGARLIITGSGSG